MDRNILKAHLERITGARPPSEDVPLAQVLAELDAYSKSESIPPKLEHYLSKRSYVKALAWLEDPSTPHVQ